jgi:hypothetical protein
MLKIKFSIALSASILLSGCLDDSNSSNYVGKECDASSLDMAIQTVAADYSSSAVAIGCSEGGFLDGNLIKTASDYSLSAGTESFYHIGKAYIDTISKYDFLLSDVEEWTYSTNEQSESTSNPYKIIEVSESKAYVIRYNTSKVWVVDPSAFNEADFKKGELDLSNYLATQTSNGETTTATQTDMSDAVIADGKLFVAMQRLRNGKTGEGSFGPYDIRDYTNDSIVAIFNIADDTEIGSVILNGHNVRSLTAFNGKVYAASFGDYDTDYGELESIDTNNYTLKTVLTGSSSIGSISDFVVASDTQGFVLTDQSQEIANVYTYILSVFNFDPSTNELRNVVNDFSARHLTDIEIGPNNALWIASSENSNPGVYKVDPSGINEDVFLGTNLNATKIVFKQ